jgi:hypothetical protein
MAWASYPEPGPVPKISVPKIRLGGVSKTAGVRSPIILSRADDPGNTRSAQPRCVDRPFRSR